MPVISEKVVLALIEKLPADYIVTGVIVVVVLFLSYKLHNRIMNEKNDEIERISEQRNEWQQIALSGQGIKMGRGSSTSGIGKKKVTRGKNTKRLRRKR